MNAGATEVSNGDALRAAHLRCIRLRFASISHGMAKTKDECSGAARLGSSDSRLLEYSFFSKLVAREVKGEAMTKTLHGKIHGKTIELDEDLGLAEGREVEVQVRLLPDAPLNPGAGFLRTEGALADDPEWDAIIEQVHQGRKVERRPQGELE